jgi:phospholipid/cholesterol/gamma-HCH transport system substrate-binding protein
MENRSHALIAGLFVILMSAAVVITAIWLSGETADHSHYILMSEGSVSGLNPEAAVRFRGVKVGKVEDIGFDPENSRFIQIRIGVDRNVDDDGNQPELLQTSEIDLARIPMRSSTLDRIVYSGQDLMNSVNETVKKMNILLNDQNQERFAHILKNIEDASSSFGSFTEELQPNLKTLPELTRETSSLLKNADQLVKNINRIVEKVDQKGGIVDNLSQSTEELADTIPRFREAIDSIIVDAQRVNRVLLQLEEQPRSLIFGRSPPPPGPGEDGFVSPQGISK